MKLNQGRSPRSADRTQWAQVTSLVDLADQGAITLPEEIVRAAEAVERVQE